MTDCPKQSFYALRRRKAVVLAGLLAVGGTITGAVYGISALTRNAMNADCAGAVNLAQRVAPLARGEVAAVAVAEKPFRVPDLVFLDGKGEAGRLSDWSGRTVLLNLWATWCIPCRKEMPALDALQATLGGPEFEVIAINIDTRDLDKPRAWLKEAGVRQLGYFSDPTAKVFQDLKLAGKAFGMPTTVLVDRAGCEIGTIAGPAEWASDDGIKLVSAALGR
jgi:thiol-disulfide isomerase/thioredoxin